MMVIAFLINNWEPIFKFFPKFELSLSAVGFWINKTKLFNCLHLHILIFFSTSLKSSVILRTPVLVKRP